MRLGGSIGSLIFPKCSLSDIIGYQLRDWWNDGLRNWYTGKARSIRNDRGLDKLLKLTGAENDRAEGDTQGKDQESARKTLTNGKKVLATPKGWKRLSRRPVRKEPTLG